MKTLLCAALVAVGTISAVAEEKKLGTGVSLTEATPIKALVAKPADYVGKTVRVDGVATAVCEAKGCWLALGAVEDAKGTQVRLNVEDGVIVFPLSAKGKKVSAEGVFEEVGGGHAKDAAGEHATHDPTASKKYHIKATGAVIR